MTHEEWIAKGEELFGPNFEDWAFECPICKNIAKVKDFKEFADEGATPNSAYKECIGRYKPDAVPVFCDERTGKEKPCNYAAYGLFKFVAPVTVIMDGKEVSCFAFAESVNTNWFYRFSTRN